MVKIVHPGFSGTSASVDAAGSGASGLGTDFVASWQGAGSVTNGNFAITSFTFQTPMPVKLFDFTANRNEGKASLQWTTVTETNSDRFMIERSIDGKKFNSIGSVKASGNSSGKVNYTFPDNDVANPSQTFFYRLKVVDVDGKYEYSQIVRLAGAASFNTLNIYPNPASSVVTLSLNAGKKEQVSCTIISIEGKSIRSVIKNIEKGVNSFNIDVSDLPPGVYIIKVNGEMISLQQRLVKNQ